MRGFPVPSYRTEQYATHKSKEQSVHGGYHSVEDCLFVNVPPKDKVCHGAASHREVQQGRTRTCLEGGQQHRLQAKTRAEEAKGGREELFILRFLEDKTTV